MVTVFVKRILLFAILPVMLWYGIQKASNQILDKEILEKSIESKTQLLENDYRGTKIIVAGDSRAERQIIPDVLSDSLNLPAINIGVSAGDLVSLNAAIEKYYKTKEKHIFIISTSSWQINDGAIDPGYMSLKSYQQLSLLEKSDLYSQNIGEMMRMELRILKYTMLNVLRRSSFTPSYSSDIIDMKGYLQVDGLISTEESDSTIYNQLRDHPFYKNADLDGIRWSLFENTIKKLAGSNHLFILIQPPVAPYWKKKLKDLS